MRDPHCQNLFPGECFKILAVSGKLGKDQELHDTVVSSSSKEQDSF